MRRKDDQRRKIKKAVLPLLLVIAIICISYRYYAHIGPIIDEISTLKSKGIITELINETMDEELGSNNMEEQLFIIHRDNDGNIQMVEANTSTINTLISNFAVKLQNKYNNMSGEKMKIPYGSLIGSKVLSQTKAGITITILPMSVLQCDFETDFKTEGINQTKYRIYITIVSEVRVLRPFAKDNCQVENRVLMAETVIVGSVPNSYVNVPKEDILDVTDE